MAFTIKPIFSHVRFLSGWRHTVDSDCALHDHSGIEIVHHPSGAGWTEFSDGGRLHFRPGATVVYPPRVAHAQTMTAPGEDIVIQLEASPLPLQINEALVLHESPPPVLLAEFHSLSNPPAVRTPQQQKTLDYRAATALLCLLEAIALPDPQPEVESAAHTYAEKAFQRIQEEYRTLSKMSDLAKDLGIGYDHLRHVFKTRYGVSLQTWLMRTRLERARELLQYSNLPLKAIAPLCGFGTDRHLCAAFAKHLGITPGAYRQRTTS